MRGQQRAARRKRRRAERQKRRAEAETRQKMRDDEAMQYVREARDLAAQMHETPRLQVRRRRELRAASDAAWARAVALAPELCAGIVGHLDALDELHTLCGAMAGEDWCDRPAGHDGPHRGEASA